MEIFDKLAPYTSSQTKSLFLAGGGIRSGSGSKLIYNPGSRIRAETVFNSGPLPENMAEIPVKSRKF